MASRLVLPNFVVGHFFRPRTCRRCKRLIQHPFVRHPTVELRGNALHLRYPGRCGCGCHFTIHIQMPVLFFGYLLTRFLVLDNDKKARRSRSDMGISPGECSLVNDFAVRYQQLLSEQLTIDTDDLTELDRCRFALDDDEWKDFRRRMGFDLRQDEEEGQ